MVNILKKLVLDMCPARCAKVIKYYKNKEKNCFIMKLFIHSASMKVCIY